VQADILDTEKIKPILQDADIVYHYAGLIEAEASINRPTETFRVNFEGTINVAKLIPSTCRFVYASTCNVFGGLRENEKLKGLIESDTPNPKYPYAESKHFAETWIRNNLNNYIICRFGTAFGYSDGIRFNLVSNLFVKKLLQGENIQVYGKGDNFRPFCHVRDLAAASKFLAEYKEIKNDIFHVVQENFTIKEFAKAIIKIVKKGGIEFVDKPVPFSSYHVSSVKLRNLGFKFGYNIKSSTLELMKLFKVMEDV